MPMGLMWSFSRTSPGKTGCMPFLNMMHAVGALLERGVTLHLHDLPELGLARDWRDGVELKAATRQRQVQG